MEIGTLVLSSGSRILVAWGSTVDESSLAAAKIHSRVVGRACASFADMVGTHPAQTNGSTDLGSNHGYRLAGLFLPHRLQLSRLGSGEA